MFGCDIHALSKKKMHIIIHSDKKDDNLPIKKNDNTEDNQCTHLYTLVLPTNNTFKVFSNIKLVYDGKIDDVFVFLANKETKDLDQIKPDD
jgi:hypothetical protein